MTETTTRARAIDNRYAIDFALCSTDGTWAQLDTEADAPWFGRWVEPFERKILTYREGELIRIDCADDDELAGELRRIARFHKEHNRWKGIDPWNRRLRDRLTEIGVGDLIS